MTPTFRAIRAFALVLFYSLGGASQLAGEEAGAFGMFSTNDLSASEGGAAILTLPAPGRYRISAKSPSGARIELVDMIAGPLDSSGAASQRDGRIDALLDTGAYKIRVDAAKGASGKVRLTAQLFAELNGKRVDLAPERAQSGELGDLQQRSYGLDIGPEGRVSIEAVGRALADLRLWRENGELVDLAPARRSVETRPGRAMNLLRLEGATPPGRYVVTAYGGEPSVWPDGDKVRPFILRRATQTPLDAGLFEGVIGPFGSARFTAPASYTAFRLDLPQPAPARLEAQRDHSPPAMATITKTSRDPFALATTGDGKEPTQIEVSGYEGQSFSLRGARRDEHFSFGGSGSYIVGVDLAGEGGDEVPATALLARIDKDGKAQVLAADAPRIANGRAWRGKFNLRGLTSLLFEMTEPGPVAVETTGAKLRATIEPALGALAPRADGESQKRYELAPGFYKLVLEPSPGAGGVVDVTLGAPGLSAPAPERPPSRSSLSFGQQQLDKNGSYLILGNVAPQLLFGPRIAALPADVSEAPLPLWQGANETVAIPLRVQKGGKIVARDSRGAEVPFVLGPETTQDGAAVATATIAPTGRARAVGLSFIPDASSPAPVPSENAEAGEAAEAKPPKRRAHAPLTATGDRPVFFDLGKDETQELRIDLAQPGLYRVETLGRLKTTLRLGARVTANIGAGEDNGPGHNGRVTAFLRAGAYRAAVRAKDSAGRLGFAVVRAALDETPVLKAGGVARARLAPGVGAAIPFQIEEDGRYALDLLGVGRTFQGRIEDSEGWPLTPPGPMKENSRDFAKGGYRLVVTPEDVEARLVLRLRAVKPAKELSGHGPHALPFEEPQKLQWREPQARGAPRDPDQWRFSLAGEADITLAVSEGMIAEIFRGEESLGKFTSGRDLNKRLGAGDYRVEARALAADDRLDYVISLSAKELQPGKPRGVDLPATLRFAIAQDRVVDLASFGDKEILATLKDAGGVVIEQMTGGDQDWNFALSRRLPAGAYTLELAPLGAPQTTTVAAQSEDRSGDESSSADESNNIEALLSLPDESDDGTLATEGARTLSGPNAHVLAAPKAPPGKLTLVSAHSAREMALAVERRGADGVWRAAGLRHGRAPFLAWAADETEAYRVLAWVVGGGDAAIDIGARVVERRGQSGPRIGLEPVDGLPTPICAALASLPSATTIDILASAARLAVGSSPGQILREAHEGVFAPQSERLWFAAPGDCREAVTLKGVAWRGEAITLDLAAREKAQLPALPGPSGKARLWLARSELGHAGLDAGLGMAIADDATLALAGDKPLQIWNANGAGPLRVTLRAIDVDLAPAVRVGADYRAMLPALTAQPVTPPPGDAPLAFELPPDTAVFAARPQAHALGLFAGSAPLSATYHGAPPGELLLVNLAQVAAPLAVSESRAEPEQLTKHNMLKRFFGVGGEIILPVEGAKGETLHGLGGQARFISEDGRLSRTANWGRAQSDDSGLAIEGRGFVIFDHPPGLCALWLEGEGKGPWPVVAARPVTPPQRLNLSGEAASFSLNLVAPALLSLRGGAPAIVAVTQTDRRELEAFPEGVELRRYVAAGEMTIDVYAPHAGGALAGALDIALEPVIAAHEGLNDPATLGPGETALFGFETKAESDIGLGLRAEPDIAALRLLSAAGNVIGEGVTQMRKLPAGRYIVEARAPQSAPLSVVRLAILGLVPPPASPPDDVVAEMLERAGLKRSKAR